MKNVFFFIPAILFFSCKSNSSSGNEERLTELQASVFNYAISFEPNEMLTDNGTLSKGIAKSGNWACALNNDKEFSIIFTKKISEIKNNNVFLNRVNASVWFYPTQKNPDAHIVFVIKTDKDSTISWQSKSTQKDFFPVNEWTKLNASFKIENSLNENDQLVVYLWNKGKTNILADDLTFSFGEYIIAGNDTPFATINYLTDSIEYSEKTAINNVVNFYYVNEFSNVRFSAQSKFIVADFCGNKTPELLVLNNDTLLLWQYCNEKKDFFLLNKTSLSNFSNTQKIFYTINLNKVSVLNFGSESYRAFQKNTSCTNTSAIWNKTENTKAEKKSFISFYDNLVINKQFQNSDAKLFFDNTLRPDVFYVLEEQKAPIQFIGYPQKMNPLFYEMQLISPFSLENTKEYLLCIVANCSDVNYIQNNCNSFELDDEMKNTVMLFEKK